MFGDDLDEGLLHVFGHARGVAADVEMGAGLEPLIDLGAALEETMLDVDLLALITGKGEAEIG